MTETLTPINILDATGTSKPMVSYNDGTNNTFAHVVLDSTGALISPATSALQTTGNTSLATIATNSALTPAGAVVVGASTTRPADTTTYAFGDLVANNVTAGSVVPQTIAAARGTNVTTTILRLKLNKTGIVSGVGAGSITNAIFRVHLFNVLPSVSNGDNGVFIPTYVGWVGAFDVTVTQLGSDISTGIGVPIAGSTSTFAPVTGTANLYYLIEARAAYQPGSAEVFTPIVEVQ